MDWLLLLASMLVPLVPLFFFSGCACCPTGSPCSYCDDSSDIASTQVQVDISGMTNLACTGSNCSSIDGTYILTFTTSGTLNNCRWSVIGPTACTHSWTVNVYISATELKGQIVDGFSLSPIEWQSSAAGFTNCLNWSAFNLPHSSNPNAICSGSGATFTVTSL